MCVCACYLPAAREERVRHYENEMSDRKSDHAVDDAEGPSEYF